MSEIEQPNAQVSLELSTPPLPEHSAPKAPVQPWLNVGASSSPKPTPEPEPEPADQGVAQRVAPEPAPKLTPAPEPEPEPKAKTKAPEIEKILEEFRAERDRFKDLNDRHVGRERLQYLREIGAREGVSDHDLMLLAPNVDPTTAEGRAHLDAWREKSSVYFEHKQAHPSVDVEQLAQGYKASKNGTFGVELAAKILKGMGTKK